MESTLIFAITLGIAGALFAAWAFRRTVNPALILGYGGAFLIAVAMLMVAYAMHGACHGDYDFVKNPFNCTR